VLLVILTTNKPTKEFTRHFDVEEPRVDERAFRQGWNVRSRLDALLTDRRITRGEWQSASEYRQAWEIARETSAPAEGRASVDHAGSGEAGLLAKLAAARKLREVEAVIGALATRLVVASVVHDLAWAVIARKLDRNPETVRDWTVLAIRALDRAWVSRGTSAARIGNDSARIVVPPSMVRA
jgi:hypothetical protein